MQLILGLNALESVIKSDEFKQSVEERKIQKNAEDILQTQCLFSLILQYIKELKCDNFVWQLGSEVQQWVEE